MHKLRGQRTIDGWHKCATKGAIRIGHCKMPSIGLGRGRAVPDPGLGAGARVGRARGGVAIGATHLTVSTIGAGFASVDEHVTAVERAETALKS